MVVFQCPPQYLFIYVLALIKSSLEEMLKLDLPTKLFLKPELCIPQRQKSVCLIPC